MAKEHGIGHRIAEARRGVGLTQERFAVEVGFTVASVRGWEYDTFHPRPATLRKIADVTGKTVGWFYEAPDKAAA